ncbi:SMR family transporter [Paraburkholderia lacunae]|uniref:Spermidine export protein MdtJ n=1 Tax=Paraburkholderia lacunae TaxID=2211104 RepID=A0A370NFC2_9BURK|nr:SMR family transporter [Paraburkholderia lacunae]RDK04258.1 QacE family quaternary ammonium compound efflux SMR transporter [Paraburkholderia lacunae]
MNEAAKAESSGVAWAFLAGAIVAEVTGTSFMATAARSGTYGGYVVMTVALALSYYLLSLSIRIIAVGVAYAVWEGLGLAALTMISVFVFKEGLYWLDIVGLILALTGIVCVALGEGD